MSSAHAQPWPNKPIKLIVPFPAGGPTDLVGREAANILRGALGASGHTNAAPEEFVAYIKSEHTKWGAVIRAANIKVE